VDLDVAVKVKVAEVEAVVDKSTREWKARRMSQRNKYKAEARGGNYATGIAVGKATPLRDTVLQLPSAALAMAAA